MVKILLAEDDIFLSSLLGNRLKKEGFEVMNVKSGNEVAKAAKTFLPDLILLDLIMPGKSGFEVMEEINADPQAQKTPIIVLSNLGQDTDMLKGKNLGAVQYVVKARITIDDLVKQIKDFLAATKPKA